MKMVSVYSIDGKAKGKAKLSAVFDDAVRPDLIKKAVIASQSKRYQPHSPNWFSGKQTSAWSWGTGRAKARVHRIKNGSRAAIAPFTVGGRRAHPPKVEKILVKGINRKERIKAIRSALAATANKDMVAQRGHNIDNIKEIPVIVSDDFESLQTVKDMRGAMEALGLWGDVMRAKDGRKIRAGRGKTRGRKYRTPKSILIVIGGDGDIGKGARNLPGVDVVKAENIGAEQLAPGTHVGRLTVYTEGALKKLAERFD